MQIHIVFRGKPQPQYRRVVLKLTSESGVPNSDIFELPTLKKNHLFPLHITKTLTCHVNSLSVYDPKSLV